jgi:hypothetical protein
MDRNADRLRAARRDNAISDEPRGAVALDPERRDLIAPGVDGDQEAAVGRGL